MDSEDKIEKEIKICHNQPVIYNWQTITDEFRNACEGEHLILKLN